MKKQQDSRLEAMFSHGVDPVERTVYLMHGEEGAGYVCGALAALGVTGLRYLDTTDGGINVVLNSVGGDDYCMLAIYDAIRCCRNEVIVTVYGSAFSAGCFILQAADRRVMMPNATLMAHFGSAGIHDNSPNIARFSDEVTRMAKTYTRVLLAKIQEKVPTMTQRKLSRLLMTDWYMDAETAIGYGLADEIHGGKQ